MDRPPRRDHRLPRQTMFFVVYVSIFGVLWGVGTSVLAGALSPDPITRVIVIGWFEMTVLFLTKLIVRHKLSVTLAIFIASMISIFTFSFGPPNPYKPLFVFAGLAFDAGTLFRTTSIRYWNLVTGLAMYIIVIFPTFAFVGYLIDPAIFDAILALIPFAAGAYFFLGLIVSAVLWRYLKPGREPASVREIWRQIGIAA